MAYNIGLQFICYSLYKLWSYTLQLSTVLVKCIRCCECKLPYFNFPCPNVVWLTVFLYSKAIACDKGQ